MNGNDSAALEQLKSGVVEADIERGLVFRNGRQVGHRLSNGYVIVSVGAGRKCFAHRIIWMAEHGPIPSGFVINHRNRVRHDNRIINLEAVSNRQNQLHRTGSARYEGIRPEDIAAVDPTWLAHVLQLAASGEVPPRKIDTSAQPFIVGAGRRRYDLA